MIDDILRKRPKKKTTDLNIVPILDMLTTVIFFLLMSTTFIEYTKLTLPPAKTVVSSSSDASNPVTPKLLVSALTNGGLKLHLVWHGKKSGETSIEVKAEENVIEKLQAVLKHFATDYPAEKTLQVSLGKEVKYQSLISVMDSARDIIPDIVLLSYYEVSP